MSYIRLTYLESKLNAIIVNQFLSKQLAPTDYLLFSYTFLPISWFTNFFLVFNTDEINKEIFNKLFLTAP